MVSVLLVALCLGGCDGTRGPEVDDPGTSPFDAGVPYADIVTAFTTSGSLTSCTATVPICGDVAACGPTEVLGAPDNVRYTLGANDRIEVALLCGAIIEQGGIGGALSNDFQIWATVPSGVTAIVEVSYDAIAWTTLNSLSVTDQQFDISREQLSVVRFVRLSENSGIGGIEIDAIEAFQ